MLKLLAVNFEQLEERLDLLPAIVPVRYRLGGDLRRSDVRQERPLGDNEILVIDQSQHHQPQRKRTSRDGAFLAFAALSVGAIEYDLCFSHLLGYRVSLMLRLADRLEEHLPIERVDDLRDQPGFAVPPHAAIIATNHKSMAVGIPSSHPT